MLAAARGVSAASCRRLVLKSLDSTLPELSSRQPGNRCAFPDCDEPMFSDGSIVGEVCHIHAQRPGGPRYKTGLSPAELHSIGNLILHCPRHHKIVDDQPERSDADWLRKIKAEHEDRAAAAPTDVLRRLLEVLAPNVPDNWWERPGAPQFRLSLASSRPKSGGTWTFDVGLNQIDGSDLGNLRYRYQHGDKVTELKPAELRQQRQWRLDSYRLGPEGAPFALELRFWWDSGERVIRYDWPTEGAFQSAECTVIRS